jgi:hypothetical protein
MFPKAIGEIVELRFFLKAFEQGLVASKPFGDSCRYDFIVDGFGKLSRVQIKSTSDKDKWCRGSRYRINASYGASRKSSYLKTDIDFLVAYIIPESSWYIVPVEAIAGTKTLGFFPHHSKQQKLEQYKEAWQLFL